MPGYSDAGKAVMLNALRSGISHISLHSATPGTTGASELSGNGYLRWAVTTANFGAVATGAFETNADHEFTYTASATVTHIAIWGSAGETFLGGSALTGDSTFNAEGKFLLKTGTTLDLNLTCP